MNVPTESGDFQNTENKIAVDLKDWLTEAILLRGCDFFQLQDVNSLTKKY